jgi:cytochrome c551/c552
MTMKKQLITLCLGLLTGFSGSAQESPKEEDYFKIGKISAPEGLLLEVGGMTTLPDGSLGVATRRGDVWIVENPTSRRPYFRKFASGLHEVLGLTYRNGSLFCAQRGELTKLTDINKDGRADDYETVYAWPLSGHYHEYSFGPKLAPDGSFFVTGNVAFGDEEWWRGESRVPWRGWTLNITETGQMTPWATGMRSPCGLGIYDGELFYDDNQGDWQGSGGIIHVKKGAFTGHPAGLKWTGMPNSPLRLTTEQLYARVSPRQQRDETGRYVKPENIADETPQLLYTLKNQLPAIQTPAVWLPHGVLGISNSEILEIPANAFGPFAGQLLVGDQGMSMISRVFMEKVAGEYQGAAFAFRSGFRSGVLRMAFAPDGSLFVGETNRGWGSAGDANEGLQRLTWNGQVPFEMRAVRAMPDGFEVEFTRPTDRQSAEDVSAYAVESFLYKYQPVYGSPMVNAETPRVRGVRLSEDGMRVRVVVDGLRENYIHKLTLAGVRATEGSHSLVHPVAYYTLNNIPTGPKLALTELSTRTSKAATTATPTGSKLTPARAGTGKPGVKPTTGTKPAPVGKALTMNRITYDEVKPLLTRHTCLACHNTNKRQVGPAYLAVAKRGYTNEQIVDLIYNPKPDHWPDYTQMAAMPQVPRADALKIATWINSLGTSKANVDKP